MHKSSLKFILSFRSPAIILLLICLITGLPRHVFAAGWIHRSFPGSIAAHSIAVSADGAHIIAAAPGGDVYVSNDYGASWSDVIEDETHNQWTSVAISSDGQYMAAVANGGYIWVSQNSGSDWADVQSSFSMPWTSVTMSTDGQYMAASMAEDQVVGVWVSDNYGTGDDWAAAGYMQGADWDDISYAPDGSQLVVSSENNRIIRSLDHGATWTDPLNQPRTNDTWYDIAAGNNNRIVVAGYSIVSVTSNGGATWDDLSITTPAQWNTVALSTAAFFGGGVSGYLKAYDSEAEEFTDPGQGSWYDVSLSDAGSDGRIEAAAAGSNGVWLYDSQVVDGSLDTTDPVITLRGNNPLTITVGDSYDEPGATADDNADGDVTDDIEISGSVDTSTVGTYTITYSVEDQSGNNASVDRTVNVVAKKETSSHYSGGSSVQSQVQALQQNGNDAGAAALRAQFPSLFGTSAVTVPTSIPVRDLDLSMTGDDVLALQKLLNANGAILAESGPGSIGNETSFFGALTKIALAKYQSTHGIVPAIGYFGPITRAQMKNTDLGGLWW